MGGTLIEKLHLDHYVEEFIRNGKSVDVAGENTVFQRPYEIRMGTGGIYGKRKSHRIFWLVLLSVHLSTTGYLKILLCVFSEQGTLLGVIIATVAGIPMYADIFGTIPIAEALLAKGARLGVVLSFMMGVTTLSLPSMIIFAQSGKTSATWYFLLQYALWALFLLVISSMQFSSCLCKLLRKTK